MPILVVIIAMCFHGVDIFTEYTVTIEQIVAIDLFLAPFGLGGLLRASHKTYVGSKTNASAMKPEDIKKLEEALVKIRANMS